LAADISLKELPFLICPGIFTVGKKTGGQPEGLVKVTSPHHHSGLITFDEYKSVLLPITTLPFI
jgi:hypothetical protein